MSGFRLDWASHAAAKYACEAWHYSGRVPPGKAVRIGVWEADRFIGVVVFSRGPTGHLGRPYGVGIDQVCELSRIALDEHETPVTQIASQALRMLRAHCPGMRLVISFADPAQGHVGRIYQAGNWVYLGRTTRSRAYVDHEGRVHHERAVSATGFVSMFGQTALVPSRASCTRIDLPAKYRYGMPLDKVMGRRLRAFALSYPQPAARADGVR